MPTARPRTRPPLHLQRGCERSRLEAQLVAAAYELAVPIRRRPLSRPQRPRAKDPVSQPSPVPRQGVSA